jgi:hypothetical protein
MEFGQIQEALWKVNKRQKRQERGSYIGADNFI